MILKDAVYTLQELAEQTKLSERYLASLVASGKLKGAKVGRRLFVSGSAWFGLVEGRANAKK